MATNERKGQGLTRTQVAVLALLVVVIAGVYALVVVYVRRGRTKPAPPVVRTGSAPVPLPEAHDRAMGFALGWQADATLVGVTGGWDLNGPDAAASEQSEWVFRYYSPSAKALQIVLVAIEGTSALHQVPVHEAPLPVEADWQFLGGDMLLTFLAYGGEAFLADHAQASLRVQLSARESGRSIWYVSAIDAASGTSFQVQIDALSREVLIE